MGWFKSALTKATKYITETRFFPTVGISGVSTAKRVVAEPKKEITRAVVETAVGLSVIYPVPALKLLWTGVKAVIPKTIKGKIITATAGLVGYGILKESPKAREYAGEKVKALPDVPATIVGFGEDVGKVVEGEKDFGKEEFIEGAKKAGVVGAVVGGVIVGAKVVGKVKEKIEERKEEKAVASALPKESDIITEKEIPVGIAESPILPQTAVITTGKKPYKRRTAKKTPSIRQYVRVNIINRPVSTGIRITNKRFITEKLLNY